MSGLVYERYDDGSKKEEIHKFLIDTFTVNTLQEILPYSEKESEGDFDSLSSCENVQLVYNTNNEENKRELVAVATGEIGIYSENKDYYNQMIKKNFGENFAKTMKFLIELGKINADEYGIKPDSKIYTSGVTCVSSTMRGKRIGSALIKNAIDFAKSSGADFYAVQCINNISKRVYEKQGFTIANTITYEDYFKNDAEKLARIDQKNPAAFYMIKKLQ